MKKLLTIISLLMPLAVLAQPCQTAVVRNVVVQDVEVVHTGSVMSVGMTFVLDDLYLRGDQQMLLTPALYFGNDTVALPRLFVNGRRQHIQYQRGQDRRVKGGDYVVKRENGREQSVRYHAITPYKDWMDAYTLGVFDDDCGCGKLIDQSTTDLLTVIPKPEREPYRPDLAFVTPPVEKKIFRLEKQARITFVVNKTDLNPSYMQNPRELDSIYRTIQIVKDDPNITITNINIHGTASPESPYSHNTMLASGRAATLKDYVCHMVSLPEDIFTSSSTPENWAELITYLEKSDLTARDEILAICRDESINPDAREAKIKKLYPQQYKFMLREWYPDLRRTTYRISYVVREFTVEEAKEIMKTKPQQLSLNELYRVAQTYEPGSDEFKEVMEIAVRLHPEDECANLNAAITRIYAGDLTAARRYLQKAGHSSEAQKARETLEIMERESILDK